MIDDVQRLAFYIAMPIGGGLTSIAWYLAELSGATSSSAYLVPIAMFILVVAIDTLEQLAETEVGLEESEEQL